MNPLYRTSILALSITAATYTNPAFAEQKKAPVEILDSLFAVEADSKRYVLNHSFFGKDGKRYTLQEAVRIPLGAKVEFISDKITPTLRKAGLLPGRQYTLVDKCIESFRDGDEESSGCEQLQGTGTPIDEPAGSYKQ
jgi:hypothetical protein